MKLLKSQRNDFPQYYAEYSLNDLGNDGSDPLRSGDITDPRPGPRCETRDFRLESLDIDIKENGLTHPIIIWAHKRECRTLPNPELPEDLLQRRNILYVQIGHQRVWIAKRLGYTHISAYHVMDQESYDKVRLVTISEEYWQKYTDEKEKYLPTNDVMDGITTRII